MVLQKETRVGLNYGQLLSTLSLLLLMGTGFAKITADIAVLKNQSEVTTQRIERNEASNKESFKTIVCDVKESLKEIKEDIKEIKNKK